MDLKQRKLNKSEWNGIEVKVSPAELSVLHLITQGYHDVNIKINNNNSIFSFLKIEFSEKMEDYLYNVFFREKCVLIEDQILLIDPTYKKNKIIADVKIKTADKIRLDRFSPIEIASYDIYEFMLLNLLKHCLASKQIDDLKNFHYYYYSLYKLIKNNIAFLNRHVRILTEKILNLFQEREEVDITVIIENSVEYIEQNEKLLKYSDMLLYEHQKEIFTYCKMRCPKLILYMAPTGTGKTLTPIALSEEKKIIFVCAARHVGLALAKSAISINKKIAFAFGCESADDIRLHYFAAKDYTRNKRTGGIGKVDNSVGDNVEIIICDIKSYLPAMYYMLAFFNAEDIIMYWDEPTITLDYAEHEFHTTIQKNWIDNKIPNIVLSSATLPKRDEINDTVSDFLNKFPEGEIFNIVSHDCKKSIPIINKDGFVVLPHYLSNSYSQILNIVTHCNHYLTLLRYFDLKEVVEFIRYINQSGFAKSKASILRYFDTLDDITMKNIKIYYLYLLQNIVEEQWINIFQHFERTRVPRIFENTTIDTKGNKISKIKSIGPGVITSSLGAPLARLASQQLLPFPSFISQTLSSPTSPTSPTSQPSQPSPPLGSSGIFVTTKDAYTLTSGPTIFISDDVEKIAKFCIQQANIPKIMMDEIMKKIDYNNIINARIADLETIIDDIKETTEQKVKNDVSGVHNGMKFSGRNKSSKDLKMLNRENPNDAEEKGKLGKLTQEVNSLRAMIKFAALNDTFVPNSRMHLEKWANDATNINTTKAFTSNIDETIVNDIMALNGVENSWKILLMMGIGVFITHENITYTEIMKKLADEQKLYMIIATSDYIYGTNYQFCHGFLSKDLNLTQEKIIQAMGRIGRTNIQQNYTVRFRDDEQILKLFTSDTDKPEVANMNKLFCTL